MGYLTKRQRGVHRLPSWAQVKEGDWRYVGWISRQGKSPGKTFEELVERAKQSDHGEVREVDIYEQGAVCWVKG